MTTALEIQSHGLPPERHSDRIVGMMLQHLAVQSSHLAEAMKEKAFKASDGTPRGQRKLEQRLQQIGTVCGRQIVQTALREGKRGHYRLSLLFWSGYDSNREREITVDDTPPAKPLLCLWHARIESEGKGRNLVHWRRRPICFISHHILSRAAQRIGVRTLEDVLDLIREIIEKFTGLMLDREDWLEPPPQGWHIPLRDTATLVLQKYRTQNALIAVTVLEDAQV
jgi:hypothetical protein